MRNSHRKSRYGCRECKKRHVKCDETRPSCANCRKSKRICSFTPLPTNLSANLSRRPRDIRPAPESNHRSPSPSQAPDTPEPERTGRQPSRVSKDCLDEGYGLLHLELLHHAEHEMGREMVSMFPGGHQLVACTLKEAFKTAYLMDELVALAAAHKSRLLSLDQEFYRIEATRLQTRSLARFKAQGDISEEQAFAAFLFSSLLGQHVLFDIFSVGGDLLTIIDKLVHCMKLHQGIRHVINPFWPKIKQVVRCQISEWGYKGAIKEAVADRECAPLLNLLEGSDIGLASRQACEAAIEALQHMFDISRSTPNSGMSVVQEWPLRVPLEFVELINQRRAEALVILAYYGVLLYQARNFWAVANAGRLLVRNVTDYLGGYWGQWLTWPNKEVADVS